MLTASTVNDITIAERHFASTSSLAISDVFLEPQRSPRVRDTTRRISFEDERIALSNRDRINDLRDPDAVLDLDLSDEVFETPRADNESRRLMDGSNAPKARKVSSVASSGAKARTKRKAKASPPLSHDGSQFRSSAAVAALIKNQIDTIESTRLRSKNLSGPMSHTIKLCVQKIKMALTDLCGD